MITFRQIIINRINKLEKLVATKTNALAEAPEGRLRISGHKEHPEFYRVIDGHNKYINKKDESLADKLAQKTYDVKALHLARDEIKALTKLLQSYPDVAVDELYGTLTNVRQEMIRPVITPDEEFLNNWYNTPFTPKEIDDNVPLIITNNGERVRSKSEKCIADRYLYKGIKYKYECPLKLDDGTVLHPDFTLMNMLRRQEVYHEHLGKMDEPEYVTGQITKYFVYERNGIYIGDRLFITAETRKRPVQIDSVDQIIRLLR